MNRVGREEILGRWFNGCSSHTAYEFLWKHYLLIDHKKTCKYRWITHWETKEPYSNNRSLEWHTVTPSEYRERYRKLAHRKPLYLGVECWPFGNMASHLCSLLLDRRKDIFQCTWCLSFDCLFPFLLAQILIISSFCLFPPVIFVTSHYVCYLITSFPKIDIGHHVFLRVICLFYFTLHVLREEFS